MLPGGSLLGSERTREVKEPHSEGASYYDTIEFVQEEWNSKEEWSFANWDEDETELMKTRQHHDYPREGDPVG